MNRQIDIQIICPYCLSEDVTSFDKSQMGHSFGEGFSAFYCFCNECDKMFNLEMKLEYKK